MGDEVTFLFGLPYQRERLLLAASPDDDEPYSPYTVWYTYFADDLEEPWAHIVTRWWAVAASVFRPPDEEDWAIVGMSNEGHLHYTFGESELDEKIPGAGVYSEGAKGWGYMSALKQIGDHLYACGDGGQVYKRLEPDQWVHMDEGLLQAPDVSERLLLSAIDGPRENAIYLVGSLAATGHPPRAYFWNGQRWRQIELPPVAERLTNIYLESESRIWLCGANGTLLLGNAEEGFKSLSTHNDNQLFYSLCKFQGKIYLGSNLGLFVYDPADHAAGILEVVTGLTPELQDANIVDSVDQVLWSIGPKDIARFDGQKWERIHHPDNPHIGV